MKNRFLEQFSHHHQNQKHGSWLTSFLLPSSLLDRSIHIQNKKLQYKTKRLKDKHLDTLIVPHPLMGKMTLREIIMWTAHHTEHHYKILKKDY